MLDNSGKMCSKGGGFFFVRLSFRTLWAKVVFSDSYALECDLTKKYLCLNGWREHADYRKENHGSWTDSLCTLLRAHFLFLSSLPHFVRRRNKTWQFPVSKSHPGIQLIMSDKTLHSFTPFLVGGMR
jgi:hypothetical protein